MEKSEVERVLRERAESGHPFSQCRFGDRFLRKRDIPNALYWYNEAAKQGHTTAMLNMAIMYDDGDGVDQDYLQAAKWYQMVMKQANNKNKNPDADSNIGDAQYRLGVMYEKGNGVQKDLIMAHNLYFRSAEAGYSYKGHAFFRMGVLSENRLSSKSEIEEAIKYFEHASYKFHSWEQDHKYEAQYRVAALYHKMINEFYGDWQTGELAVEWYNKAIEANHPAATHGLAMFYSEVGEFDKALPLYYKAAELGNADAQAKLGDIHLNGVCILQNFDEALKWFRKAAEQGQVDACFGLGVMNAKGYGADKNLSQALYWYSKAAEGKNARALYELGLMYQNGYGVIRDVVLAYMFFNLAVVAGDKEAANSRLRLAGLLNSEQLREAQAFAAKCNMGCSFPTSSETGCTK